MPFFLFPILLILALSVVACGFYVQITPMPSSLKARRAILSLLPPQSTEAIELGCGWGGLACDLAARLSCVKAFELSPLPWAFTVIRKMVHRQSNLFIYRKNFFHADLRSADCLVCYLSPRLMEKLKGKLEKELKTGCWVISNSFALPGWSAVKTVQVNDLWKSVIYLYRAD